MTEPQIFQPTQEDTEREVKKMIIGLFIFFTFLVVISGLIIANAQSLARYIPFSAEERFIKPYEKLIARNFGEIGNSEIDNYLQTIGDGLAHKMNFPANYNLKIHYVDTDTVNAFATLGGHIFVFRGLIEEMPDENSLAMILSHEIAHIQHRDPIASVGRVLALQMIYGFITSDYAGAIDLVGISSEAGLSFFNRAQEQAADIAALEAINLYYGHINGFDSFFKKMIEDLNEDGHSNDKTELTDWFSSHPGLNKRISYLRDRIKDEQWQSEPTVPISMAIKDLIRTASKIQPEKDK